MNPEFTSVQMQRQKRNVFDMSHDYKTSLDMGRLVPTFVMDVIPGDKVSLGCQSLLRLQALISPVMHRVDVYMHYFFVPNRILWDGWEEFIVKGGLGGTFPAPPFIEYNEVTVSPYTGSLLDYFGLPSPLAEQPSERVSALPLAAYAMIYNEYYRDENLVAEVDFNLIDGDNSANDDLFILRNRAWNHDYFTSALPFAQKGLPVTIPIAGFSDVPVGMSGAGTSGFLGVQSSFGPGTTPMSVEATPTKPGIDDNLFYAETSKLEAQEATINDLRTAFKLQEWLEKNARGGTRYVENILAHFGVRSSDKRLQRPEYITGTKTPVVISEVLNTTGTEDAPQGNMAGHGVSVSAGKYGSYYAEEHGYIIGIMSVMPRTAYQQGIERHWLRLTDATQYYWPAFARLGEQAILNREIYAFQGDAGDNTFGYIPRYSEYKYINGKVTSQMRTTLNFWHLGRTFASPPALNQTFIECTPAQTTRIFAVDSGDGASMIAHIYHKVKAVRLIPKFSTPSL